MPTVIDLYYVPNKSGDYKLKGAITSIEHRLLGSLKNVENEFLYTIRNRFYVSKAEWDRTKEMSKPPKTTARERLLTPSYTFEEIAEMRRKRERKEADLPALPLPIPGMGAESIHGKGSKGAKVKKDRSYSKYYLAGMFDEVPPAGAGRRRPRATPEEARARRASKYSKNVPEIILANMPNKFSTGTPFEIGTARDSVLTAVNNTVAKISGIPLNRKNRNVIGKIYGDELRAVYDVAGADFTRRLEAGEFVKVRNVPKALRHGNTLPDGPTMKKQRNLSHINIPGVVNRWV